MADIIPLRDLVYILPIEDPSKIGNLYVPDKAKQRVDQGIVYKRPIESDLRVGDHVLFSGYDGDEIVVEGIGKLIVMPEYWIVAVLDDELEESRLVPARLIQDMIDKTNGNMKVLGYESEFIDEFTERFSSFIFDHLFAELQF